MLSSPSSAPTKEAWLSLSAAARYLGVHFTTLRRWADAGQIPCVRTLGGRRRFALADLQRFLARQTSPEPPSALIPWQARAAEWTRQNIHSQAALQQGWFSRFNEEQRQQFRRLGQRFLGLLFQFSARQQENGVFLEEGKQVGVAYGELCCAANLSIGETVQGFLFFQRSLLDAMHEPAFAHQPDDPETWALYQRMSTFLDHVLLTTVDSYCRCRGLNPGSP